MPRIFTGLYDSSTGDKREYNAQEFATVIRNVISNGVVGLDDLKILPNNGLSVKVNYGSLFINGRIYDVSDNGSGYLILNIENNGNSPAAYYIVAQLDINSEKNTIDLVIKKNDDALTQNAIIHELLIAKVNFRANATSILESDITDYRSNPEYCGYAMPKLFREAGIAELHTHDVATNQNNGFESAQHFQRVEEIMPTAANPPTLPGAKFTKSIDLAGNYIDNAKFR